MIPVIITTTVGHTSRYKNKELFDKTLRAFLHSLRRQTERPAAVILMCHDLPLQWRDFFETREDWISADPAGIRYGSGLQSLKLKEWNNLEVEEYGASLADMSRKTLLGQFFAHRWAEEIGHKRYWILRMDSDDLLAEDHVEFLNQTTTKAVFNCRCHVFDPQSKEIAECHHPWSTTCNAMLFENRSGVISPAWDYHNADHTRFRGSVIERSIPHVDRNDVLCILTNTGNNLSGRPGIRGEPFAGDPIPLTKELIQRYGLETLL